jgi:uncharacterized peroxidase-related enzyme
MSEKYNTVKEPFAMLTVVDLSRTQATAQTSLSYKTKKNEQGDKITMIERINYHEINKKAVNSFAASTKHVTTIDEKLRALIELRVSQINGCVYCLDLHCRQAREAGESQQRLDCLAAWQEYPLFDERERAAFAWAEAITLLPETHAPFHLYDQLGLHFSDEEIVDLTFIIAFMNTWNRLAVSFRQLPDPTPELA